MFFTSDAKQSYTTPTKEEGVAVSMREAKCEYVSGDEQTIQFSMEGGAVADGEVNGKKGFLLIEERHSWLTS